MTTYFRRLCLWSAIRRWRPPAGIDCTVTFSPATGRIGALLESEAGSYSEVEFDLGRPIGPQMRALDGECRAMLVHDRLEVAGRVFEEALLGV